MLKQAFNSGINSYALQIAQVSNVIYVKNIYELLNKKNAMSDNTQPTIGKANNLLQEAFNSGINSYAVQIAQVSNVIYIKNIYELLNKKDNMGDNTQPTIGKANNLLQEAFNSGINSYALQEAQVAETIYVKNIYELSDEFN